MATTNKKFHYDHVQVEEKWQSVWEEAQLFQNTLNNLEIKGKKASDAYQAVAKNSQSTKASNSSITNDSSSSIAINKPSTNSSKENSNKDRISLLFAFAYPSGSGLHVGHVESKTALDILARFYRMQGKEVFFPVGWDAFGLPAENYAIKTGVHPEKTTTDAINTFRRQIKRLGISYDWANELATCHPGYYKWTQWLFLQLYRAGLAYRGKGKVNWCSSCQTVLANEQVVDGKCERCDTQVEQRDLEQWYFKITQYQDELLSGLDLVDWPEPTKMHQRHWIGKKTGIAINYAVEGVLTEQAKATQSDQPIRNAQPDLASQNIQPVQATITCFTTRPDTNFGATFIVLAPEHEFVQKIISGEIVVDKTTRAKVQAYALATSKKSELDRQMEGRKKTGVFTGFYALNGLNGAKLPIWVSDFVLAGFGTGAVVGVPGHDKRDFEFAQTFDIPVIRVVVAPDGDTSAITSIEQVQEDEGVMINSEFLDGLPIEEAIEKMMDYLEDKGMGKRQTSYKLRDWLISRQRYWGAPIPVVYDPQGKAHPVKKEHLPWLLPTDVDFKPTGESPLKSSQEFIARTEKLYGKGWRPEFDTMDTFVDSSWYYLRYLDSRNTQQFANKDNLDTWMPYSLYLIGPEHIVLHLLYSRFFCKFLRDQGYLDLPSGEPFAKMRHQGMILGPDGKKMSKSKGNVINPDKIVAQYGADTLRLYEMFMGPLEADKPWDDRAVAGVRRFLDKIAFLVEQWLTTQKPTATKKPLQIKQYLATEHKNTETEMAIAQEKIGAGKIGSQEKTSADGKTSAGKIGGQAKTSAQEKIDVQERNNDQLAKKLHQAIKKVGADIAQLKFNTAIAMLMEFVNLWNKLSQNTSGESNDQSAIIEERLSKDDLLAFIKILAPFAPFLAEELWQRVNGAGGSAGDKNDSKVGGDGDGKPNKNPSIHLSTWPAYDEKLALQEMAIIAVQVNGKLRAQLEIGAEELDDQDKILSQAKDLPAIAKWLQGKKLHKEIYVRGKIVSLVVG